MKENRIHMEKDNRDVVYAVVNSFIVDQKEE
jgi:hypothetical protein